MKKIKAIVVDDSAFMRKVVEDILNTDSEIEVVGTAKDGKEAVELVNKLKPDIVTMDVEMPIMDGIEATKNIMQTCATPILMLSAVTRDGSETTLKALENGAVDFIQKPSGSISLDIREISEKIIKKVKEVSKSTVRPLKFARIQSPVTSKAESITSKKFNTNANSDTNNNLGLERENAGLNNPNLENTLSKIGIMMGSSTGGPPVVSEIISRLPMGMPPIFVVQHMPAGFTRVFAERIDRISKLKVVEASNGTLIKPNHVYIAPGDTQMLLKRRGNNKYIEIDPNMPKLHGTKPTVDITAEYVANIYGNNSLGIILTGIGKDGAVGMRNIKEKGGYTIGQNKESCIVYGMPKTAYELNALNDVLPPSQIPQKIEKCVERYVQKLGSR
ncbi:two-component system chemotaxis response regulator CheB [Methanococcus voltae]|uniref:Protein-glutamate methylesterase/protein-glutamine glutaminase n=2 Tax=Methanococcus voltae TaxID=2188 RepID=A0A8J7S3W8_METVO|nr:chemotaxis response regulator protein-glutamate methylesterase [Methanococcus voltae]MBP2201030.1 two-component system chemotaxis response regulator CheB [Methanococcus voltae]MCS3921752.1 two-component system chemotaxis response regulator CheB [Methanococcus voltae PS]